MARILQSIKIYHPDSMGGIQEAVAFLAPGMRLRHDTQILTCRGRGFHRRYTIDNVPVEAISSLSYRFSLPLAPCFPFVLASRARDVDLLAIHHPFPLNDIGVAFGLPARVALVVHWHAEIVGRGPFMPLLTPFFRHTLRRAQRVVVSDVAILDNSPLLTAVADKCVVVPFGIDTSYWGHLTEAEERKVAALRITYPRLVVATGRLVSYKGFDVLIRALCDVEATVIIVGDGPLEGKLQELAHKLGVSSRVIFAGRLSKDELKIHMHAARIFAFPSVSSAETFGVVQLEAMATGLPIINTALPTGVPNIARHGLEAITLPPGNPSELAQAISKLLNDKSAAKKLGDAGRLRARTEYDQSIFVARIEKIYEEAIRSVG